MSLSKEGSTRFSVLFLAEYPKELILTDVSE